MKADDALFSSVASCGWLVKYIGPREGTMLVANARKSLRAHDGTFRIILYMDIGTQVTVIRCWVDLMGERFKLQEVFSRDEFAADPAGCESAAIARFRESASRYLFG
jgi:hypothetical protein